MFIFQDATKGAQTIIYTATEPGLEEYTGGHFQNCQIFSTYPSAKNQTKQVEVFNETLKMLGLEKELSTTASLDSIE